MGGKERVKRRVRGKGRCSGKREGERRKGRRNTPESIPAFAPGDNRHYRFLDKSTNFVTVLQLTIPATEAHKLSHHTAVLRCKNKGIKRRVI